MTDDEQAMSEAKVRVNYHRAINSRTEVEEFLESVGTTFTSVWLCIGGTLVTERHVLDPTTIQVTVKMSAERLHARTAAYAIDGEWEVTRYRDLCSWRYPTEEAAKMVALHRAR